MRDVTLSPLTAIELRPPDCVDLAASVGYDGVGIKIDGPPERLPFPIVGDRRLLDETARRLEACGIGVVELDTVTIGANGPTIDIERVFEAGARLGARIVCVVGADRERERLADSLRSVCDGASRYGFRVALEFVRLTEIKTAAEAIALADAVDHPAFGLVVDTLHLARGGSSPSEILARPELIALVHAADAPLAEPDDLLAEAVGDRLLPGDGELPLRELFAGLPADTPIGVEVLSTRLLAQLGVHELAARALAAVRSCLPA